MKLAVVLFGLLCAVTAIPSTPSTNSSNYDLRYRIPRDCDPATDCRYFVGLEVNANDSEYLDVFLTANAPGWVAVGFSETPNMRNSDVVGCIVRDNVVEAIDTYNVININNNQLDPAQGDIMFGSGNVTDGRITCSFSRLIAGDQQPAVDQNLNGSFFLLFGFNANGRSSDETGFSVHETSGIGRPTVLATEMVNPVVDMGELPLTPPTEPPPVPAPNRAPADYRLRRRDPAGCDPQDCDYFMGIDTNANNSYLDFYLTAEIGGWVAVGFSSSPNMFDADVVGCNSDGNNVVAVDTSNPPTGRANNLDLTQDVVLHESMVVNGRITCVFSRLIIGSDDAPQDRPLNTDYFFLFGVGENGGGSGSFPDHQPLIPPVSEVQLNPATDEGDIGPQPPQTGVPAPNIAPADYRLRRRDPPGCDPQNCDYFMGIDNNANSSYLDFYLTAEIGGWVAVGFSSSSNMFDADVIGCNLGSGDTVSAVDTYNPPSGRTNTRDDTPAREDIVLHSSSFENGRITCVFSRLIIGSDDAPQDRPLNTDYYFLFGVGERGAGSGSFPNHQPLIPPVSDGQFNPATDEGDIGVSQLRQQLLQAHGILMLIAWPLLAFTAIFFAAWMKQALPNGEWFQVHRAFHIAALIVAAIGFLLAFVANMDSSTPGLITLGSENKSGTAHFVLGIIIMALQIANPIISIFRCKPTGQYRWIFNLIHGFLIGLGVEFLAYINIGIGVSIFSETQSDFGDLTIFWVYLAFAIFGVVLNGALLLFFTFEACFKGEEGTKLAPAVTKPFFNKVYGSAEKSPPQGVEMTQPGEKEKPAGPPPRKPASKDAPIRWLGLGLFLGIMLPLILAVIIMIAATGNLDE